MVYARADRITVIALAALPALLALAALALAGCGRADAPESAGPAGTVGAPPASVATLTQVPAPPATTVFPPPAATAVGLPDPVTVRRTGGFAGVNQVIVVDPDGSWRYTPSPGATPERGRLSAARRAALAALAGDPARRGETGEPQSGCADGFVYEVTAGPLTSRHAGCGTPDGRPVTAEIVRLLEDATSF